MRLTDALAANRYPGRGLLWCRTGDGSPAGTYFMTGRSPASRARRLADAPGGGLLAVPTDDREHDALRHYTAVRPVDGRLVLGNGEQVDTVADRLAAGATPATALDGLDYEPDPPIHTPRITLVADPDGTAWLGAARRSALGREPADRMTLRVAGLRPGEGVLLTTYASDGETVAAAPPYTEVRVSAADRAELLDEVWTALDPALRVTAAVCAPGVPVRTVRA
ncbi:IMP cyclohydrolase [Streptomyces sp. NPDC051940]|uniref:IMP cyclohydrolase n=1 Tax=Streptomyces sp. NPDC051940 TaxID=3155675 RepID=UPI003445F3A7